VADGLVPDWLHQRARLTPDRLALIAEPDVCWTFRQLDDRVGAAAGNLERVGVGPGDRVGLRAANGWRFVVAVHALARLGAVVVPINTRLTRPEVDWQVESAATRLLLDQSRLAELMAEPGKPVAPRDFDLTDPHSVLYTSGTTGRPKGAILTYGNHWWSAIGSALNLGLQSDDRWLACLPLFHVGGLSILLRSVIYGIPVVVHERFDAGRVNQAIDQQGLTIVSVVSPMLDRMLAERQGRPYASSLRCLLLGGGPAPRPLLEAAAALGAPVVQTYGLTEAASQVTTLSPEDALRRLGSAGKPLFPTQVRLHDGEILVRGPTVSPGYLDGSPTTRDGWLHTGDLGVLDADGYLYILDRRDDLVISGGENVYPAEVEAVLLAHPDVAEAGVYGVHDAAWGQVVEAVVRQQSGADVTPADLIAFCRGRLAGYKVPRHIRVVDESLPRTAAGKLLRRQLARYAE
jgi:O-succinylbenzoic acid--CoA ligase